MSHRLFVSLILAAAVAALLVTQNDSEALACEGAPLCAAPSVTTSPLSIDPQS